MNIILVYIKNQRNIGEHIENQDTNYTKIKENLKSIDIIRKN